MTRKNPIEQLADETIIYGGLRATRKEVYLHVLSLGHDWRAADRFAFGQQAKAVDPASVAHLRSLVEQIEIDERERPFREWCGDFLAAWRKRTRTDWWQPWEDLRAFFACGYRVETAVYELVTGKAGVKVKGKYDVSKI